MKKIHHLNSYTLLRETMSGSRTKSKDRVMREGLRGHSCGYCLQGQKVCSLNLMLQKILCQIGHLGGLPADIPNEKGRESGERVLGSRIELQPPTGIKDKTILPILKVGMLLNLGSAAKKIKNMVIVQ